MKKIIINQDTEFGKILIKALEKLGIDDTFIKEYNQLYEIVKDNKKSLNYSLVESKYYRIMGLIDVIKFVWDESFDYCTNLINESKEVNLKLCNK